MAGALEGVRILDLTHMLSGPYASMILADLGAETIKVEPLTGEGTRRLLATDPKHSLDGMGAYFLTLNRNKKSVAIDLKNERGRALFYRLVGVSDIVISNFTPGVPERLGIDYRSLAAVNPRIIACTVTGFGSSGPGHRRPAFDQVAQATGGGMSITGTDRRNPIRAGIPIGDLGGGMFGVMGVLAALYERERSGRGQEVDISMLDGQISMLNYMATMHFLSGENPHPIGNAHFVHVPYGTFECADGFIVIAVITDNFWQNLKQVIGCDDLDKPEIRPAARPLARPRIHQPPSQRDPVARQLRRLARTARGAAHPLCAREFLRAGACRPAGPASQHGRRTATSLGPANPRSRQSRQALAHRGRDFCRGADPRAAHGRSAPKLSRHRCRGNRATAQRRGHRVMNGTAVVNEVGPRDGLQSESRILSVDERLELIRSLEAAGLRRIEVGSFSSPRAVPAMAGTDRVLEQLNGGGPTTYTAMVPNVKGYGLAREAGAESVTVIAYASETMAGRNVRMTLAEADRAGAEILRLAAQDGVEAIVIVAVAFGCPFEGAVDPGVVADVAARYIDAGASQLVVADTIGAADPAQVGRLTRRLVEQQGVGAAGMPFPRHARHGACEHFRGA